MRELTVAGFRKHHRNTVAPVFVLCMSDGEFSAAITRTGEMFPDASEAEVYALTMHRLRLGEDVPQSAHDFAARCHISGDRQ